MSDWSPGMACDPDDHEEIRRETRALALRDAADVAREHCTNPLAGDEPCEVSCDCCAIAARLDALAQEVERG